MRECMFRVAPLCATCVWAMLPQNIAKPLDLKAVRFMLKSYARTFGTLKTMRIAIQL
jgi:hypothetical protein